MVPQSLLSASLPPSVAISHFAMRMTNTSTATAMPNFPMVVLSPVSRTCRGVSCESSTSFWSSSFFSMKASSSISPSSNFCSRRAMLASTVSGSAPSPIMRPHSEFMPTPVTSMRP